MIVQLKALEIEIITSTWCSRERSGKETIRERSRRIERIERGEREKWTRRDERERWSKLYGM